MRHAQLKSVALAAALLTGCNATPPLSSARSVTGGNSGDPLRLVFRDAKTSAARMVRAYATTRLQDLVLRGEVGGIDVARVDAFMTANRAALAAEIEAMTHSWGEGNPGQQSCAQTGDNRGDPLVLAYEKCKQGGLVETDSAQKLLIHEATHHFGLHASPEDEDFADQIALAAFAVASNLDPTKLTIDGWYIAKGDYGGGQSALDSYSAQCELFRIRDVDLLERNGVRIDSIDCGSPVYAVDGREVDLGSMVSASFNQTVGVASKAKVTLKIGEGRTERSFGRTVVGSAVRGLPEEALASWYQECIYVFTDVFVHDDSLIATDCGEPSLSQPDDETYQYTSRLRLWR